VIVDVFEIVFLDAEARVYKIRAERKWGSRNEEIWT
jgi:hypothetical protein